jgi:hypothetical protein
MKWEYEVIELLSNDPDFIKGKLNDLAADGWRLIACDTKWNLYIFERLKPNVPSQELLEDFMKHNLASQGKVID